MAAVAAAVAAAVVALAAELLAVVVALAAELAVVVFALALAVAVVVALLFSPSTFLLPALVVVGGRARPRSPVEQLVERLGRVGRQEAVDSLGGAEEAAGALQERGSGRVELEPDLLRGSFFLWWGGEGGRIEGRGEPR